MTIGEIKKELNKLNGNIKTLLNDPAIWVLGEFSSEIRKNCKTADDWFLFDELYRVMNKIEDVSIILNYLSSPIKGEYVLHKNSRGRYECKEYEYTSGSSIEYYYYDDYDDAFKWARSRVEYNSDIEDYYIVGAPKELQLEGLKVRLRK